MALKKIFVHCYTPNKLAIHAYFDFAQDEDARLISVDNSNIAQINCTYQYMDAPGKPARKETKTDEFTYPWQNNTATVSAAVKDVNGTLTAEQDIMDTSGAPID